MKSMLFQKITNKIPFTIEWNTLKYIRSKIQENKRDRIEFPKITNFLQSLSNLQLFLIGFIIGISIGLILLKLNT